VTAQLIKRQNLIERWHTDQAYYLGLAQLILQHIALLKSLYLVRRHR
jgi:hypothetical protein